MSTVFTLILKKYTPRLIAQSQVRLIYNISNIFNYIDRIDEFRDSRDINIVAYLHFIIVGYFGIGIHS